MPKTLYMMKGLPASGKSTRAREMLAANPGNVKRVCKDDLRAMLDNGKWSKANEHMVLRVRDAVISLALQEGKHVICDDTNLAPGHEARLCELAREHGAVFEVVDFTHVSVEECIERDQKRLSYVGEKVIREMHQKFLARPVEPVPYNEKLPVCIIADIDGTVALKGDRSPYDWSRVQEDRPHWPVIELVRSLFQKHCVVFVSGRKECCREITTQWLEQYFDFGIDLYMRRDDDDRDDVIVKREIYEQHIKGRYNVQLVLDDREKVVRMWRQQGLTCLAVADGDF